MKLFTLATTLVLLALAGGLMGCRGQGLGWKAVEKGIATEYPDVPQMSVDSLAAWITDPNRPQPTLFDVRTEAEYAVSHLPNAVRMDPDVLDLQLLSRLPKDASIVLYCSVGYRSSGLAEKLRGAGWTNVANLQGSLFRWVERGYPVYRNGQALGVPQVHPYNALWGRLVDDRYHAYAPPPDTTRRQ